MRLWHPYFIKHLPDKQLLSQWRELNSIYVKQDKHILINFVYEYSSFDLLIYSLIVITEMKRRRFRIKSFSNLEKYFGIGVCNYDQLYDFDPDYFVPFNKHFDNTYFKICAYNLYEKYIRGQEGFSENLVNILKNVVEGDK